MQEDTVLSLRPMQESDVPQLVQIEARAALDPWTSEAFVACLQTGLCCWVLEHNGVIDAYGIMGLSADSAHIWSV